MQIIRKFPDVQSFIEASKESTDLDDSQRSSHVTSMQFSQVSTASEAYTLLQKGFPQGTERMKNILDQIRSTLKLPSLHQVIDMDVEGCAPNVEAHVLGLPEDMFFFREEERKEQPTYLKVQLEASVSSCVTPLQMSLVGAALYAAMEGLKTQGTAVEYILCYTLADGYKKQSIWQCQIPLNNNLDIDTTAFLLTHPAQYRVITFSLQETEPAHIRRTFGFQRGSGYGMPTSQPMPDADLTLSFNQLTQRIQSYDEPQAIAQAAKLAQDLVDSKFQCNAIAKDFIPWEN